MAFKTQTLLTIGQRNADSIPCVFACDEAYAPYTAVALASVYQHASCSTDVTILTPSFSAATVHRFERIKGQQGHSLTILQVPLEATQQFPAYHHWPQASYLRMAAAEVIDHERVIYLDSDVLVRAPLQELFKFDLGDCPVAGVPDFDAAALARTPQLNWLDLPAGDPYISTGVMLMDLTRMRHERTLQATYAAQMSPASSRFRFGDQCVLNVALAGRKAVLDPRWNIHTSRLSLAAFHYLFVAGTRGIFHFCGVEKPWMAGAHPSLLALWVEYLSLTDYTLQEVRRPSRPANLQLEQMLAEQRAAYFRQRT